MKQYVISLALLIAALVAFPTSHTNAQSQAEMNRQAAKDFEKADAELNSTYAALMAKLPDAGSKRKLKESQRAWLAFRDAEAARAAREAEGGSMAPTLRDEKMTELTQEQIKELKAMLDHAVGSGPKAAATSASTSPAATPESAIGQAQSVSEKSGSSSTPSPLSPDNKWEYKPATEENGPQIVRAGTNDVAGDLSDDCNVGSCGDHASVLWAPDSKRFVFEWGQGRTHHSSFYRLQGDHWQPVKPAPDDEASDRLDQDIAAHLKKQGESKEKLEKKGLYLRFIWQEIKVDRWIDSNTAQLYAGERRVIAREDDPGEMSDGFGADFLFTVKFDDAGKWKIEKTRRMSEKEVEKREKQQ